MSSCRASVIVLALLTPGTAAAQTSVTGGAEWTVSQTSNTTDSGANQNSAFWQNYSLGFHFPIIDPRLVKLDTELTFRTNKFFAESTELADQQGRQKDVGFQFGAFVLPAGVLPFHVQASRVFTGSTGELAFANPVRGSLMPAASFETESRRLSLGGQLNSPGLPRAELTYRKADVIARADDQRADQREDDLTAGVVQDGFRLRQAFRYQRTGYEYVLNQAYGQHIDDLGYDLSARLGAQFQLTARAGRRSMRTRADVLVRPVDLGDNPYSPPPTDGHSQSTYVTSGINFEPTSRFAVRFNGTWDNQQSAVASTESTLANASLHAEVLRGLVLKGLGNSGQRAQIVHGELTEVTTTNGVAGATYTGGPRWFTGTVSANVGQGANATPQGERSETRFWSREAGLTSSIGWLSLGAGYERLRNEDAVLDYGNYDSERIRGSFNLHFGRLSIDTSGERLEITRGFADTLAHHRQNTAAATLSGRLWHELTISGTAGGFDTVTLGSFGTGLDRSVFWGVGAQTVALQRALRLEAWARAENMLATSTRFDQRGLSALARAEWRLRALAFALEYRHNDSRLLFGDAALERLFRGHQLRFSLTRQFGFRL